MVTILLFSLGSTITYSLYFILAWRAVRQHGQAARTAAGRSVRRASGRQSHSRQPHG